MFVLKLFEIFLLQTLFGKEEYRVTSKNFNPLKILIIFFLLLNNILLLIFSIKAYNYINYLESNCNNIEIKKEISQTKK